MDVQLVDVPGLYDGAVNGTATQFIVDFRRVPLVRAFHNPGPSPPDPGSSDTNQQVSGAVTQSRQQRNQERQGQDREEVARL